LGKWGIGTIHFLIPEINLKKIALLVTISLFLLVFVPNLTFATHEDDFWVGTYTPPLFNDGKNLVSTVSFIEPIVGDSPECEKKGRGDPFASLECQEKSFYQITSFEFWKIIDSIPTQSCVTYTTTSTKTKEINETNENEFNKKIGSTIRKDQGSSTEVSEGHKASTGVKAQYGGISAYANYEFNYNKVEKHDSRLTDTRTQEIESRTLKTTSISLTESDTAVTSYNLETKAMKYNLQQRWLKVKYDLWTPVMGAGESIKPAIENIVKGGDFARYDDVLYFKAYDLPGNQYYIHTTYEVEYPTEITAPNKLETAWDCEGTTGGRMITPHENPPEPQKGLNVIMRPTQNHANIIVIDQDFKPVPNADITLGVPSFPLNFNEPKACTSKESTTRTDQYGSAYFYLGTNEPLDPYVYSPSEISKQTGLVAMFPGNGDSRDLVSPDRTLTPTDASLVDGIVGEAFNINDSPGLKIGDSDDFDMTKAVTISAWIKQTSFYPDRDIKNAIVAKGGNSVRNYGLYLNDIGFLHLSYVNANGENVSIDSPVIFTPGQWTHVAAVIDTENDIMKIYINGREEATRSPSGAMVENNIPFSIGVDNSGNLFSGYIDEVAIYNKALSQKEIQKIRDTIRISSACNPGEESGNNKLQVVHSDFKTISRDLAFHEDYNVWYILSQEQDPDLPPTLDPETRDASWVRITAGWWKNDQTGDSEFINSLSFLIEEDIIQIPNLPPPSMIEEEKVPPWFKNAAGWWAEELTSDKEFYDSIKYMVKIGVIQVKVG